MTSLKKTHLSDHYPSTVNLFIQTSSHRRQLDSASVLIRCTPVLKPHHYHHHHQQQQRQDNVVIKTREGAIPERTAATAEVTAAPTVMEPQAARAT